MDDPALKNLREWVILLLLAFLTFDVGGVQYGLQLAHSASTTPNQISGEIAALVQGPRGAYYNIYVTSRQLFTFYGLLGGAGLALLSMLGIIIAHGIRRMKVERAIRIHAERRRTLNGRPREIDPQRPF